MLALLACPPAVTTTFTWQTSVAAASPTRHSVVPLWKGGTVAVISLPEAFTVNPGEATPPKVTEVAPVNPAP